MQTNPTSVGQALLPLDIGVQRYVGLVEVTVEGVLDERTTPELCAVLEPLLARRTSAIDLDCTELVDVDGFGLALLRDAHVEAATYGGRLSVRWAQPAVLDRILAARLDGVLDLV